MCRGVCTVGAPAWFISSYICKSRVLYSPGWWVMFGLIKPGEPHSRIKPATQKHCKCMQGYYLTKLIPKNNKQINRNGTICKVKFFFCLKYLEINLKHKVKM